MTYIVDRGTYGKEVFKKVAQDPTLHLITWQKGYVPAAWAPSKITGTFILELTRNDAADQPVYPFEYVKEDWDQDPRLRRSDLSKTALFPDEPPIPKGGSRKWLS